MTDPRSRSVPGTSPSIPGPSRSIPGTMTVPPRPGLANRGPEPLKHVIAEYKHQAQTITCVCGWHGSSASADGRSSDWSAHVAANRTKPR